MYERKREWRRFGLPEEDLKKRFLLLVSFPLLACVCSPSLAHAKIPGRKRGKEEKSGPTDRAPIACEGEGKRRKETLA